MSYRPNYSFLFYGTLLLIFFQMACSSDPGLPNTPESVARQWQDYVDENEFTAAKKLSAPAAVEWLDWISNTLTDEMLKEDTLPPGKILQMSCVEKGNTANCAYTFDDNGFVYQDTFNLLKVKGQWLVDIPAENLLEDNDIEELLQQLKQDMEAAPVESE